MMLDTPHLYLSRLQNGAEILNSCTRCGFPKSNLDYHPVALIKVQPVTAVATITGPLAEAPVERWKVFEAIATERVRQIKKFGDQQHNLGEWYAILGEEFGEVAHEMLSPAEVGTTTVTFSGPRLQSNEAVRKELVQVAAVAVQIIEAIDAGTVGK